MADLVPHHEPHPRQAGPTLFFVILGLILALLIAFLVFHPNAASASSQGSSASQH